MTDVDVCENCVYWKKTDWSVGVCEENIETKETQWNDTCDNICKNSFQKHE